ncbi:unnamed protein product [Cyprideis torosa]|uniref:Uncharacterized protein n=1 Tax=Cyprideis torosa TaxID=163714 RepID=A0A7R8WRX9_9CRUS|nr:unnamed protein product [Cyprideis torosa]CAG0904637.1 unnamed protein product [Cyprideis torosa]
MLARRKQKKRKKKMSRAMKEKLQLRLRKGHNRQEGNNKEVAYTNPIDVTEGENLPASELVTPVPPTPNLVESPDLKRLDAHIHSSNDFKYLIIDLSAVGFIDSAGVEVLAVVQKEFLDAGVLVFFAAARDPLLRMFVKTQFHDKVPENLFFPTIFDAFTYCLEQQCGEEFLDNPSSEDEEGLQFTTSSVGQAPSECVFIRIMNDIEDKELEVSAVADQQNTETVELKEMPLQTSSSASSSSSRGTQTTETQASVCPSSEEHVKTLTRVDESGSK